MLAYMLYADCKVNKHTCPPTWFIVLYCSLWLLNKACLYLDLCQLPVAVRASVSTLTFRWPIWVRDLVNLHWGFFLFIGMSFSILWRDSGLPLIHFFQVPVCTWLLIFLFQPVFLFLECLTLSLMRLSKCFPSLISIACLSLVLCVFAVGFCLICRATD